MQSHQIIYSGFLPNLNHNAKAQLRIEQNQRRLIFSQRNVESYINFEDITALSFDEKTTRSAGKTAAGAIIGGFLTGGVGLIAGAAIGARKKDASSIYIHFMQAGRETELSIKPTDKLKDVFAALSAAIAVPEPANFNRVSRWGK